MAYHVRPTDQAYHDLDDILGWLLAQHAGETGLLWFERLQLALESLSELPQRCRIAPESREFGFEVRELLHGRKPHLYRVLFTIANDTVAVLHVRHGRRLLIDRS